MLHLGSIGDTSLDVDVSFLILCVFFVAMNYDASLGIQYALIWVPVVFVSVLIHELAHAAMIAVLGFGSSQVVLGGMGGVTMNRRRARPWQDLLISLAGPLSSFAMMGLSLYAMGHFAAVYRDAMLHALVPRMAAANYFWGMFNLIPLAPLDGGHATREFFRMFLNERVSFVMATWFGLIVGVAVVVWGLITRDVFIALFVGWLVYASYERWQYFRKHGIPGD
jgi:stage IV sporulation protein FB